MTQKLTDEEKQSREDKATKDRAKKADERMVTAQKKLDMIEVNRQKRVATKILEKAEAKKLIDNDKIKSAENKKADKMEAIEVKKTKEEEDEIAYLQMVDDFLDENPIHFDENQMYWDWDWSDRVYNNVDETSIMVSLTRTRNIEINKLSEKNRFLEVIRQHGRRSTFKDLPLNFIQFKDFVVDIETGERFLATPEYFYVNSIPHNMGSCSDTPTIDKLFMDWVGEGQIDTLYEIMAYMMYKSYPIDRWFILLGTGSNGKGKFTQLISKFLNKKTIVATSLNLLANSRFESARLYKKNGAIISELNNGKFTNIALLKQLTGDEIPAEKKGIDGFEFVNYAKILISSNTLPATTDDSDGFYRRTLLLNFPNQFKETGYDILSKISEEEYENLGYKLISILKNLLKNGKFNNEGSITSKRERFGYVKDPVKSFINKYYVVDYNGGETLLNDFISSFDEWRSKMAVHDLEKVNIIKTIIKMGFKMELSNGENSIIGLTQKVMTKEEMYIEEFGSCPFNPSELEE